MNKNFIYIYLSGFLWTVSSIWIIVPRTGNFMCNSNSIWTNHFLADAVQPGCESVARLQNYWLGRFAVAQRLFSLKPYRGPLFSARHPLYEWKINSPRYNGIFHRAYPRYNAIFEWNQIQKTCTPHGVISIEKSGNIKRCSDLHVQSRPEYPSNGWSSGSRSKNSDTVFPKNVDFGYMPESVFGTKGFAAPRGFYRSESSGDQQNSGKNSFKTDEVSVSDASTPSSSRFNGSAGHPQVQKSFDNPPKQELSPASDKSLVIARPGSTHQSQSSIQGSNLNSGIDSQRSKVSLTHSSPKPIQLPQHNRQDSKRNYGADSEERQPPTKLPIDAERVKSKIAIEDSKNLGLASLLPSERHRSPTKLPVDTERVKSRITIEDTKNLGLAGLT